MEAQGEPTFIENYARIGTRTFAYVISFHLYSKHKGINICLFEILIFLRFTKVKKSAMGQKCCNKTIIMSQVYLTIKTVAFSPESHTVSKERKRVENASLLR